MVRVSYDPEFKKKVSKIKDVMVKKQVVNQIKKINQRPTIGKPMRFERKGTREVYIKPYRLVYSYQEDELILLFLDLYHKKKQ